MEIELTEQNFKGEILDSQKAALVDFWAAWCGPCQIIAPIVREIANQYQEKITVGKVNVDEVPQIAAQYNIMSIPTLIIFKKGKIVDRIIGAVAKEYIEEKIKAHI